MSSVDLTPGGEFFLVVAKGRRVGPYRVVGEARHVNVPNQPLVAYQPASGGVIWLCSLAWFASNFVAASGQTPPEVSDKEIGALEGPGY